ncbi:MAG: Crp/Fnr family transcriptional regulator [Hungatella sp.]|jgi:CRP/FNR family cyclic AMP-dependent transcriptional regulator|nr:Crp/Fnr family transcriptional regulator [Hungatella sp.]
MDGRVFTREEERVLRDMGIVFTVQPGHLVYMKGDPADRVYYILKGRVRIFENLYSGREMTLDVVESGRIFGESAFAPGNLRPACVQAVNKVILVSFRMTDVLPYFRSRAEFALHFLQLCSNTMDHLTARMEEQCLLDRYGKVASFILDVTEQDSVEKGTAGGVIPYTHEDLSVSLGLNRSTVTMVLKEFEKQGCLERGYGYVKVVDRRALEAVVEGQKDR